MTWGETICRFCAAAPDQTWRNEVVCFTCGSRPYDLKPRTPECWQGLVWKLKERIEALEAPKKKPLTLRELSIHEGWNPDKKKD